MIISIRFKLPDEKHEWESAINGTAFESVLYKLSQEMRSDWKHGAGDKTTEYWRDRLYALLKEESIVGDPVI